MDRAERRRRTEAIVQHRIKRSRVWWPDPLIGKLRKGNQTCSCRQCRVASYYRHRERDWKAERRNGVAA